MTTESFDPEAPMVGFTARHQAAAALGVSTIPPPPLRPPATPFPDASLGGSRPPNQSSADIVSRSERRPDRFARSSSDWSAEEPEVAAAHVLQMQDARIGDAFPHLDALTEDGIALASLDTRSRNTLHRLGCKAWADVAQLTVGQLLNYHNTGRLTVERILIEAAKRNRQAGQEPRYVLPFAQDTGRSSRRPTVEVAPEWMHLISFLEDFGAWALRERSGATLSDLISLTPALRPIPTAFAARFETTTSCDLELLVPPGAVRLPSTLLTEFLGELGDHGELFAARCLRAARPTLEELGLSVGLTRERVRQLVVKATALAQSLRDDERFLPLVWRATDLAHALGNVCAAGSPDARAALAQASSGLDAPASCTADELMLWLAGPYENDGAWLTKDGESLSELVTAAETDCESSWLLSADEAEHRLRERGVMVHGPDETIAALSAWKAIGDGWLVRWDRGVAHQAEVVLRLSCRPLTPVELKQLLGDTYSQTYVQNTLAGDDRFVRVDRTQRYGLAEWGLEEYSGIAQEIAERIERGGGAAKVEDIASDLSRQFGVSASSVKAYTTAPHFLVVDGIVTLRTSDDPYLVQDDISRVAGLYREKNGVVLIHVAVDADVLRGSGRTLAEPAAAVLGVMPGDRRVFDSDHDRPLLVSWPSTSFTGPSLGSLRPSAERLGLGANDVLRIRFDLSTDTFQAEVASSMSLVEKTGLAFDCEDEAVVIANAIGTTPQSVRAKLQARGDAAVVDLLPPAGRSATLDQALAQLDSLLG